MNFASTLTDVLDVLPSMNVSNFLVADLQQPLPDFAYLAIIDDDPVRRALVENLVPIVGGLRNFQTILVNLWNTQGAFLESG